MKKLLCAIAATAALLPTTSMANEFIVGVKAGIHSVDHKSFDPAPMLSAQLSYEFLDLVAADFALELEAGTTVRFSQYQEEKAVSNRRVAAGVGYTNPRAPNLLIQFFSTSQKSIPI